SGVTDGETERPRVLDGRVTEEIAMRAVLETERALGNMPVDVSSENLGYDIESRDPRSGETRFIEVKGRRAGADTITLTRNETLTALNSPERYILAIVEVKDGQARPPRYVRNFVSSPPDLGITSVNYNIDYLLGMSEEPS